MRAMKHSIPLFMQMLAALASFSALALAATDADRAPMSWLTSLVQQESDKAIQHKLDPQSEARVMEPIVKAVVKASNLIREQYSK